MSSHENTKVNDNFKEWMKHNYVKHGEVKANRGKGNKYLGMTFDFKEKPKAKIKTDDYAERMNNEFPMKISNSDTDLTIDGNDNLKKVTSK